MITLRTSYWFAGLLAVQACSSAPVEEQRGVTRAAVTGPQAGVVITSNNGSAYCAEVTIPNPLNEPTNLWSVIFDIQATSIYFVSGANLSAYSQLITASPVGNQMIAPGASATFGFCASTQNTTPYPTVIAWNMQPSGYTACESNTGLLPTKASLAVAMGKELGRWAPLMDLVVDSGTGWVTLSNSATGWCNSNGGCPNTVALLGQQNPGLASVLSQSVFNPVTYGQDLIASLNRQSTLIQDLTLNNPGALPPAHRLTLVGGPTNLGPGSCGPHYVFQVDKPNGTPLSATEAANMANSLCYFGYGGCGNNPYLGFTPTGVNCPSGRTCVAIDPTDGDNGTLSSTSTGAGPTYPGDRVYDPAGALLKTPCITTSGKLGMLTSVCSTLPSTCGYDYCVSIDYPCRIGGTYQYNRVFDPAGVCLGTACITTKGALGAMTSKCSVSSATCGTLYCLPPTY